MFEKEVTYISRVLEGTNAEWTEKEVTKIAKFKDLSRTDDSQRKLQWMIMSIAQTLEENKDTGKITLDFDILCDLTYKYIKTLIQTDETFTAADRDDFIADNGAVMQFGMWALGEKISPFFQKLITK